MRDLKISGQRQTDFYIRETDFTGMLKLTLPFTNQSLLDLENNRGQRSEWIAPASDEQNIPFEFHSNNRLIEDGAVCTIALKCATYLQVQIDVSTGIRVMTYILSGALQVKTEEGRHMQLLEHTHHSLVLPDKQSNMLIVKGEAKLFMVCMTAGLLKKLVPMQDRPALKNPSIRLTTTEMDDLIHSVVYGDGQISLHRVLLVSKALQLLFLDLEQLKNNTSIPVSGKSDLHKLEKARKLISDNLQSPYSIIELAREVGLNDFKLKKGFKKAYGNTVFGYLAHLRMEKAKMMLATLQYTVSEVAHEVGYKNAHHFTVAFKKKYGYLPSKADVN